MKPNKFFDKDGNCIDPSGVANYCFENDLISPINLVDALDDNGKPTGRLKAVFFEGNMEYRGFSIGIFNKEKLTWEPLNSNRITEQTGYINASASERTKTEDI